jgi:molybdopterin-guanine dinucleotide biosynthesis protein MobB
MMVVSVLGLKKSGKTTSCEALIREFKRRGYKVGAVKSMHHAKMTIDSKGKDTWRHKRAGADFVASLSNGEMGYIETVGGRADFYEAMKHFPADAEVVVCEGVEGLGGGAANIVALKSSDDLRETLKIRGLGGGRRVMALTGIFSNDEAAHAKYPVFNCLKEGDVRSLAALILNVTKR